MTDRPTVMESVAAALGRTLPPSVPPAPPVIDETIVRLVHTDLGLPDLFATRARDNKMGVEQCYAEELLPKLIDYLKSKSVRSIVLPKSKLLEALRVLEGLRSAGFDAKRWDETNLDALYTVDCGLTDAWAAVAEVGGLVMRESAEHGRALSLVPPLHVAILEPKNFVADLVDLFQKIPTSGNEQTVIITGPSKTSDIEMTLVVGVHGPTVVQIFILQ